MPRRLARIVTVVVAGMASAVTLAGQSANGPSIDLPGLLARVGERVEAYYQRAQTIVCTETIRFQLLERPVDPLNRRLTYDLRMSWDKSDGGDDFPEGNAVRTLKAVNGRSPKPGEEARCLDPKPTAIDTLSFMLPHHQRELTFTYKGIGKVGDGRSAVMVDYAPVSKDKPKFTWTDSCFSIDAPTRTRGRLWIDRFGGDILRVDETVMGPLDIDVPKAEQIRSGSSTVVLDRWDSSIQYKMVTFTDPNEIVLLPETFESTAVVRGQPRQRTTHTYAGYQRFVTGGRVVTP